MDYLQSSARAKSATLITPSLSILSGLRILQKFKENLDNVPLVQDMSTYMQTWGTRFSNRKLILVYTEFHWFTKPKLSMPTRFSNSQGISCKHTCSFLLPDLDEQTSVTPSTPFPWLPASTNWGGASALLQSGVGINKICRLPQHAISKLSVFLLITFRSIMALPIYAFTCLAWL